MDKYYTPEKEEFCWGFEYESEEDPRFGIWGKQTVGAWSKFKYFDDDSDVDYRVKYLDKEDIESLGWKSNKDIQHYYKSPCNNFVLRIKYEGLCIYIYNEYTVDKLIFEGKVKNKSELVKLLKQLQIG